MLSKIMRVLFFLTSLSLALLPGVPQVAHGRGIHQSLRQIAPPSLAARGAFILDDTTGRALYAHHADMEWYPASTVKMMTALVTLQHLRPNSVVTVPARAATVGGTTASLVPGERLSVRNLLYGLLLPSGNDAAVTFAVAISGSTLAFSNLMNAEARRLHLWHTHFLGATGLDSAGQYSTARDLAWLAHAMLRNSLLAHVVRTRTYRASSVDGRYVHTWTNLDQLLGAYPGEIGVKTGTTPLAGANLVASSSRDGRRIIVVILGSTVASRYIDARNLLNYGWRLLGYPVR
jgi:serine-type D-Ala-D-Ala carboxypeptidase (penicillin-binding protein 5/6)